METCSGSDRSSILDEEVHFFSVCERIALDTQEVVNRGNLLNVRQCADLSFKLSLAVDMIRLIIKIYVRESSALTFTPFLQILYQSLKKAKLLVTQCAEEDQTAAAVFQVQNEGSFQEILWHVWSCLTAIYDSAVTTIHRVEGNILFENYPSLSWFELALVSDSNSDREDLRQRLKSLEILSSWREDVRELCLTRHLLRKLSCTSQECLSNFSDVCKAGLWKKEMEPPETWGNSSFLGSGSGASGVCRTQWLGVPCARKEFHASASEGTFLKEASILSHLKHPRIVNFICCGNGEAKGDRFIAMELMEKSLFDVIVDRKGAHFALPVAVDIIFQIAEGMWYLHDQGVAHRDLKPQNVVVNRLALTHLPDQYYCVKLVDFGMSKTNVEVSRSDTISIRGVGTTRYRAPEVHPKAQLDKAKWLRVDVYSFAMTCAHVLSLKAPFEDMEQLSELYARLLEGERPMLPSGLPQKLVDILGACWDVDPLRRPSFGDICSQLCSLRFEILGGKVMSNLYSTICTRYGKGMGNSRTLPLNSSPAPGETRESNMRPSSSVASGQTSYYTAHSHFSRR